MASSRFSPGRYRLLGFVAVLLASMTLGACWLFLRSEGSNSPPTTVLQQARLALKDQQYQLAESLAQQISEDNKDWIAGRLIAGEAATRDHRLEDAIAYYRSIPRTGTDEAILAAFSEGEASLHHGELTNGLDCYRYVLKCQPQNAIAHRRLAYLLSVTGQRWAALEHYLTLIRLQSWTLEELILLADLERSIEQREFLEGCHQRVPNDDLVILGLASHALAEGKPDDARKLLIPLLQRRPDLSAAQVAFGEILVHGDEAAFLQWHRQLPVEMENVPDLWYVRGLWYRKQGELEHAARCLWNVLKQVPTHRRATYQLGQVLSTLSHPAGQEFSQRAALLFELTQVLDSVLNSRGRNESAVRRATLLLHDSGRMWEAWAWATTARGMFPQSIWTQSLLSHISQNLAESTPYVIDDANLAMRHDFSTWELPSNLALQQHQITEKSPQKLTPVQFEDQAAAIGVDFTYLNGDTDWNSPGTRMFEQTGGGVAVLDFDRDGDPDLYLTQGGTWKMHADAPTIDPGVSDTLFRNQQAQKYGNVTAQARIIEAGYGQGAAVGDFDNDGFPDIYVANIGRNQLLRNNGDGTFTDIIEQSGLDAADWTTSCLIADLNDDGHPDLFDVTYVDGPQVFQRLCGGFACSPKNFSGIPDRTWLSQGDGTFRQVADNLPHEESKGMGVVAFKSEGSRHLQLFVSNDQVPNYMLQNRNEQNGSEIRLENAAFTSGVAFNVDGLAMASMGIAAGDADGNGLLDFFVTTFRNEANTLYLQDTPGLFVDATRAAGLFEPTFPYVGWGTQFLDADLDGNPDLVSVNGHVDDYRARGDGYHMRSQFFRNRGHAHFVEVQPDQAGPYFEKLYLGRGMARIDWNQDGKPDFIVSNMNERAAVVTNLSEPCGHFIKVRLSARETARDAIGTTARITTSQGEYRQQLVAGDGFQASNERVLSFGLANADKVHELTINWPSGATTTLSDLPVDITVDVVEGRHDALLWHREELTGFAIP